MADINITKLKNLLAKHNGLHMSAILKTEGDNVAPGLMQEPEKVYQWMINFGVAQRHREWLDSVDPALFHMSGYRKRYEAICLEGIEELLLR